jgi:hypothetical protein
MPIKGLTNELRMPRAGKIHLGIKSTTDRGQEYPTPTDYFVCPPEVIAALGDDKPKELSIMFPTEEPEQFAPTYLKFFSRTRGLICKGDGETADRTVNMRKILGKDGVLDNIPNTPEAWPVVDRDANPEDIGRHKIECRGEQCPDYGKRGCGRMMMLQFLMPDVPGLGIYQIDTGSRNGILNIYGGIELVRSIVGRVSMIPLKLRIGPMQTVSPETGRAQTNYVMSLHCDLTMEAMSRYRQMGPGADLSNRQLPDPDDEVPEYLIAADLPEDGEEQSHPKGISAPKPQAQPEPYKSPPAEIPKKKPVEAKPTRPGYGSEVWSLSVADMGAQLRDRRVELGVPRETLAEQAVTLGLDNPGNIKPDQFMALMDWMMAEFGDAMTGRPETLAEPEAPDFPPPTEGSEMDSEESQSTGETKNQNFTKTTQNAEKPDQLPDVVGETVETAPPIPDVVGVDPQADTQDAPETSLGDLLNAVTDDYTWEQTSELASQFGVRTRIKLESDILFMSVAEWEKLDGTPATAARRLLRSKQSN